MNAGPSPPGTAALVYSLIWAVGFWGLALLTAVSWVSRCIRKHNSWKGQLALLFVFCFAVLKATKYTWRASGTFEPHNVIAELLFAFPTGFLCSCFSLLLFHWARLFSHLDGGGGLMMKILRLLLVFCNFALYIMLLLCAGVIVFFFSDPRFIDQYATARYQWTAANNIGVAFFDVCTCLAFALYGLRLARIQRIISLQSSCCTGDAMRDFIPSSCDGPRGCGMRWRFVAPRRQVLAMTAVSAVCLTVQGGLFLYDAVYLLAFNSFPSGDDNYTDPLWMLHLHRAIEMCPALILLYITRHPARSRAPTRGALNTTETDGRLEGAEGEEGRALIGTGF
ncbi:hypothetical protein PAPYR_6114 [Paratrimastix pyriformis]|uniref:THH1/TOM1/TOM3 domain-containing protein n=1 Tax=Paratrimastix pyriformis TaxID=342808 RepID=A0ABQ8UFW1_9EUKA|nr:hypothetical protein PAPYR_6114 [Paratrimastix pyriformis]